MENLNLFSLKDKVILVTGGYGNLGKSIVSGLIDAGGTVVVLGRDKNKFNKTFGARKQNLFFEFADVSNSDTIIQAFKNIKGYFKKIDVLINNAVYLKGDASGPLTDEEWQYSIDGSLNSVYRCIREIIPYFVETGSGKIINVSTMYGVVAPDFSVYSGAEEFTNPAHYEAGKAGVIQLTRYYASLLGKRNILVNAVSPGPFPGEEARKNKKFIKNLSQRNPLKRVGHPDELKGIFIFLSSGASNFITGQNILVDGGWTCV